MKIYNSMIVWILIVGMVYKLFKIYAYRTGNRIQKMDYDVEKVPFFVALLIFGYIIFWVGIRSGVADTATYIRTFQGTSSSLGELANIGNKDSKALGFEVFNIIFKSVISQDYHDWLMAIAILSGVPVMLKLRRYSVNFVYSSFLFITTLNFTWLLNGMRQFIVVAIGFYISDWIVEGKWCRYMITVLILSSIHYTALILIPAYWIARAKIFGSKILLFVLLMGIAVICIEPFINAMEFFLEDTAYGGYTQQFAYDDGVNPIRFAVMMVTPMVAFCARKQLRFYNNAYIDMCVNMSVISAGLYFLGIFTSGILMGRLPIYFEVYNMILLPFLIEKCFEKNSRFIMYAGCTLGFLAFYYLQMVDSYYVSELTGVITR